MAKKKQTANEKNSSTIRSAAGTNATGINAEGFIPGQDIDFKDLMKHYDKHSEMVDNARELAAQELSQREHSLRAGALREGTRCVDTRRAGTLRKSLGRKRSTTTKK